MGGRAGSGPGLRRTRKNERNDDRKVDVTLNCTPRHYHSPVPSGATTSTRTRGRRAPFPRYAFGPKPKRRTEFVLLVFGSLLIVALYIIGSLGQNSRIPPDIGPFLGVILGLAFVAHMANRWLAPDANAVILPLAAL